MLSIHEVITQVPATPMRVAATPTPSARPPDLPHPPRAKPPSLPLACPPRLRAWLLASREDGRLRLVREQPLRGRVGDCLGYSTRRGRCSSLTVSSFLIAARARLDLRWKVDSQRAAEEGKETYIVRHSARRASADVQVPARSLLFALDQRRRRLSNR